jgi:branched-chain amino acid transport system substrate-binding protein
MKSVNGNVEDRDAFLAALQSQQLTDVPRGPLKIDSYGNPIENVYIRKVERVGGELQNTVVKTYPDVSQFWTYGPEKFLQQPVYDRSYPPLKP